MLWPGLNPELQVFRHMRSGIAHTEHKLLVKVLFDRSLVLAKQHDARTAFGLNPAQPGCHSARTLTRSQGVSRGNR
jgi:hypothetical protein